MKSSATTLLDTLLVLLNLDVCSLALSCEQVETNELAKATQSASGAWDVHLIGAYELLEAKGGTEVCGWSPRIRAQVAMLVW